MQMYLCRVSLILTVLFLFVAVGCKKHGDMSSGGGEVAARVGRVDIPLSKVDKLIDRGLQGSGKKLSDLTAVELAAARLQALDTLITEEALFQRAVQDNIQISDDDVRNHIQKVVQSSGLSQDDFQKSLKEAGLTEEEFKEEQRRQLAIEKMTEKQSAVKPPTDREITDYFNQNQQQFKIGKGINLSAIIVDPADNKAKNDAIGEEQAKQKIAAVYAQLKGGADFATVARVQSEDASAYQGGDLGFLDEAALGQIGFPVQLIQYFFSMKEGDFTQPVAGSGGRFFIFKLTAKRTQEEQLSIDNPQVKAQISQLMVNQRKNILGTALRLAVLHQFPIENYLAQRILQNPDNFGFLRPTALGSSSEKPQTPEPAKEETKTAQTETKQESKEEKKDSK